MFHNISLEMYEVSTSLYDNSRYQKDDIPHIGFITSKEMNITSLGKIIESLRLYGWRVFKKTTNGLVALSDCCELRLYDLLIENSRILRTAHIKP